MASSSVSVFRFSLERQKTKETKTDGQTDRACSHLLFALTGAGPELEPGAGNSIQVSHVGDGAPTTGVVTTASRGNRKQKWPCFLTCKLFSQASAKDAVMHAW